MVARTTYARAAENPKLQAIIAPSVEGPWAVTNRVPVTGATGDTRRSAVNRQSLARSFLIPIDEYCVSIGKWASRFTLSGALLTQLSWIKDACCWRTPRPRRP